MGAEELRRMTVALAGNPNVGKSTLFNALTGLHQHTGNWPGKTVALARGRRRWRGTEYAFVDLPGTYALSGGSEDERVAAEFITGEEADCTVVVCDGSCLERNLILALQILEHTARAVVCVNLMDEARARGIRVDRERLEEELGVPVVFTAAGRGEGVEALLLCVSALRPGGSAPTAGTWWPRRSGSQDGAYIAARGRKPGGGCWTGIWSAAGTAFPSF